MPEEPRGDVWEREEEGGGEKYSNDEKKFSLKIKRLGAHIHETGKSGYYRGEGG